MTYTSLVQTTDNVVYYNYFASFSTWSYFWSYSQIGLVSQRSQKGKYVDTTTEGLFISRMPFQLPDMVYLSPSKQLPLASDPAGSQTHNSWSDTLPSRYQASLNWQTDAKISIKCNGEYKSNKMKMTNSWNSLEQCFSTLSLQRNLTITLISLIEPNASSVSPARLKVQRVRQQGRNWR